MAKLAMHGHSFKQGAIGGIDKHNERKNKEYGNAEIDTERTELNFYLKRPSDSLYQECKREVETVKLNGGRLRSDQNWITEFVVYGQPDMTHEQCEEYFKIVHDYFCENVGEDNVKLSVVHMDEKTPHMHLDFMPIVRDEYGAPVKLSSKEIMTRAFLNQLHDELPKRLSERGFDVQRGDKVKVEDKPLKGRSVKRYKADMEREKVELETELDSLKKKTFKFNTKVRDFEKLQKKVKRELDYEIKKTGMFSNRRERAVFIDLEHLDDLIGLNNAWNEFETHLVQIRNERNEYKEKFEKADMQLQEKKQETLEKISVYEEIIAHEIPEKNIAQLVEEHFKRCTPKRYDIKPKEPIRRETVEERLKRAKEKEREQPQKQKSGNFPERLICKNGNSGKGFYDSNGNFYGDFSILEKVKAQGVKISDPCDLLKKVQS